MYKRILVLALVVVMVFAVAACNNSGTPAAGGNSGGNGGASEPAANLEPYEIVYNLLSNEASEDRTQVQDKLNELIGPLINATIKFQMITWGDWDQKANVALAAGEKVDIHFTADWHNYMRSISQNLFLPLNDASSEFGDLLNTYAPEAVALLGEGFIKGSQVDGINYGVPTNKELTVPAGYIFNKDLVEKYNFDITTVKKEEDLEPMLEVIKANEPDIYAYLTDGNWYASPFMSPSSQFGDAVMLNDPLADGSFDETITLNWEHQLYVDHLYRMRDYYTKGYVNPDAYLSTYDHNSFRNNGKFFVESQPLKGHDTKSKEIEASSGNPDLHLLEQQIQVATQLTTHAGGSMLAIPYTSEDPARAMMFINLMHSNEMVLNTVMWGVEGKNYEKVAATVVKPSDTTPWSNKHAGSWTLGNQFMQWTGDNENPEKYKLLKEFSDTGIPHPTLGFRFRPESVDIEIASYNNAVDAMARSLRTGAVDPAVELPKHVAAAKAAGSDKIVAEIERQYTEWKKK